MNGRQSSFDTQDLVGKEVKIYTHLNVREDAMQLYGFLNLDELKAFRLLLGVNGNRSESRHLGFYWWTTTDELRFAVLSDDVKTISKAPGIGKKTAQKLILELKDKIDLEEVFETKQEHVRETEGKMESKEENAAKKDAVDALTALGYSSTEALRAVRQTGVTQDMDVETILKLALKNMNL